jgi:hypothetical protein
VYTNYFSLKRISKTDATTAAKVMKCLALEAVQMDKLPMDIWIVDESNESLIADTKENFKCRC